MENTNWRPNAQGGEPAIDTGDWRAQLQPDSRHRIVNKIMETLKRQVPFSGQEGLGELKIIAIRFEEKIYTAAISQSDYLRKISLKMLTLESKSQKPVPNPLPPNPPGNNNRPSDPGGCKLNMNILLSSPNTPKYLSDEMTLFCIVSSFCQNMKEHCIFTFKSIQLQSPLFVLLNFNGGWVDWFHENSSMAAYLAAEFQYYGSGLAANLSRHEVN
ncbi:hypothetical protein GH714_006205 [Hevea brasiliensis]|uniref:Mediator complex subunit 15 KIX domain-containing protein n=1 Tax=Hevea brasiliensis TaxID=3981 RepID=A0A6A6LYD5_HEVBR|nr:hypothetical protein GH714_006205 [Hevea brasiliensis]